jgi:hypothetical protein
MSLVKYEGSEVCEECGQPAIWMRTGLFPTFWCGEHK